MRQIKAPIVDPVSNYLSDASNSVVPIIDEINLPSLPDLDLPENKLTELLEAVGNIAEEAVEEAADKIKEKAKHIIIDPVLMYKHTFQETVTRIVADFPAGEAERRLERGSERSKLPNASLYDKLTPPTCRFAPRPTSSQTLSRISSRWK